MLNFLRRAKSDIDKEVALEQFPVVLTLEMMEEMALFQGIFLLLNLIWFLAYWWVKPQVHGSTEVVKIEYHSDRELWI